MICCFIIIFGKALRMLLGPVEVIVDDTILSLSQPRQSLKIGKKIMKKWENKAELFRLVAEFMKVLVPVKEKQVTCTLDDNMPLNSTNCTYSNCTNLTYVSCYMQKMQPCKTCQASY